MLKPSKPLQPAADSCVSPASRCSFVCGVGGVSWEADASGPRNSAQRLRQAQWPLFSCKEAPLLSPLPQDKGRFLGSQAGLGLVWGEQKGGFQGPRVRETPALGAGDTWDASRSGCGGGRKTSCPGNVIGPTQSSHCKVFPRKLPSCPVGMSVLTGVAPGRPGVSRAGVGLGAERGQEGRSALPASPGPCCLRTMQTHTTVKPLQGPPQHLPFLLAPGLKSEPHQTLAAGVTLGKFYCSLGLCFLICETGEIVAVVVAVGPEKSQVVKPYRNITRRGR